MSTAKAPRGQRLIEHVAATTADPKLKRILAPRSLEDVAPAYNRFLLNAAPIVTANDAEKKKQKESSTSSEFWTPSPELVRNVRSNPDAEEEFHTMKLSRVLCKAISNEVEKKVAPDAADSNGLLPTRVSRLVVPASVQKSSSHDDAEDGALLLIHSCAAVLASKIASQSPSPAQQSALVWIVENNNRRDEVETVLEAVFGLAPSSFVVVSAAARTPVDLASTSLFLSSSSSSTAAAATAPSPNKKKNNAKPTAATATEKRHLYIVTTTSSSGVNANRALAETVVSATNSKAFSSLQLLIFGQTEQSIKSIDVGLSSPKSGSSSQETTSTKQAKASAVTLDTTTPRKLFYAVTDGFGNFFALCKLIQNLSRGQRCVISFATRNSAAFFVDAFYALQNKSDSLIGQASGLTLICDAENVPKRIEAASSGFTYDELVQNHISAAATRFTNLRDDRAGVFVSGFGVVPQLAPGTNGIFVQAEPLPDLALAATCLFLSESSPLNHPQQYKTNLLFVSPNEVRAGLPAALEEILATSTFAAASSMGNDNNNNNNNNRRQRDQEQQQQATSSSSSSSPASLWSLTQLPISSILRGATDKNTNLNQILEAREFQSLVRKIFALNASAYEAFRSYCLFFQTMCFGYHMETSVIALRRILGNANFGLGPKTAEYYEYCQRTAADSSAFATFLNLEAQAHRFGLENPPLLDLRTKDTTFRPRRDLYRFAVSVKTQQGRDYKNFADENLQPEQEDPDAGW